MVRCYRAAVRHIGLRSLFLFLAIIKVPLQWVVIDFFFSEVSTKSVEFTFWHMISSDVDTLHGPFRDIQMKNQH